MNFAYNLPAQIVCSTCGSNMPFGISQTDTAKLFTFCINQSCAENGIQYLTDMPTLPLTPSGT